MIRIVSLVEKLKKAYNEKRFFSAIFLKFFSFRNVQYISVAPETTIVKNAFSHKIIINSSKKTIKKAIKIVDKLDYVDGNIRKLQATLNGCFLLQNKTSNKKLNILLVGYEYETYDAQFLKKIGYDLNVYFIDIKDFDKDQFSKAIGKMNFYYIKDDLRNIIDHFNEPYFDYIFTSRACLDLFYYNDMINVLNKLYGLLRNNNSAIICHVQSFFLTRRILTELDKHQSHVSQKHYESFDDRHLILEPSNDLFPSIDFVKEIYNYINSYQKQMNSNWLNEFFNQNTKGAPPISQVDKLRTISLSHTNDMERIHKLNKIHQNAQIIGTYFSMSPLSKKGSLYIQNHISITKGPTIVST